MTHPPLRHKDLLPPRDATVERLSSDMQEQERSLRLFLSIAAAALFIVLVSIAGAVTWYVMRDEADERAALANQPAPVSVLVGSDESLARFASKDQKARLSEALLLSISDAELKVKAQDEITTVSIDERTTIVKKGDTLPLEKFQALTNDYLKDVQFGKPGILYIPPEPFALVPATRSDLTLGSTISIIPVKGGPDGATAQAQTIMILE